MKKIICLIMAFTLTATLLIGCGPKKITVDPTEPPAPSSDSAETPSEKEDAPTGTPSEEGEEPSETPADTDATPEATENESVDTPDAPAMDMSGDLVSNAYVYEGDSISVHIPQINCNSEDAQRINKSIEENFNDIIKACVAGTLDDVYYARSISWRVERNSEYRFTLFVIFEDMKGYLTNTVYIFDGMTGKEVTTDEILTEVGISREDAIELAREAVVESFRNHLAIQSDGYAELSSEEYWSEYWEGSPFDEMLKFYTINTNGKTTLCVFAPVAQLVGPSSHEEVFILT